MIFSKKNINKGRLCLVTTTKEQHVAADTLMIETLGRYMHMYVTMFEKRDFFLNIAVIDFRKQGYTMAFR